MNNIDIFDVKCDECKKTIKTNATMRQSVQGGVCSDCKTKYTRIKEIAAEQEQEQSLLSRIEAGDKAGTEDWMKRAEAGEHMLIM